MEKILLEETIKEKVSELSELFKQEKGDDINRERPAFLMLFSLESKKGCTASSVASESEIEDLVKAFLCTLPEFIPSFKNGVEHSMNALMQTNPLKAMLMIMQMKQEENGFEEEEGI